MEGKDMENLDYLCMKYGQTIPENKESETLITKILGVLQENGPYAMFLFLEEKKNKDSTKSVANKCHQAIVNLINEDEIKNFFASVPSKNPSLKDMSDWLIEVSKDIDMLFFLKKILEQTLLYARYYSKALQKSEAK